MNQFQFEHLKKRKRLRLPRPVLYVGVAIILFAFFSAKWFQWAEDGSTPSLETPLETVSISGPEPLEVVVPPAPAEPDALPLPVRPDDGTGGILSLDGEGERILPPLRISGERPAIPASLFEGQSLVNPKVYVRVGKDGLVTHCKLVSSSGSGEVDRLVLETLATYTFHPATTMGQPVEFSSVVSVPLHTADDGESGTP